MKNWIHVFVIYRLDFSHDTRFVMPEDITIKSVHASEEEAKAEVERLNKLNKELDSSYLSSRYEYQVAKKEIT